MKIARVRTRAARALGRSLAFADDVIARVNRLLIEQVLGTEDLFKYLDKYDIELSPAFDRLLDRYGAPEKTARGNAGPRGRADRSCTIASCISWCLCAVRRHRRARPQLQRRVESIARVNSRAGHGGLWLKGAARAGDDVGEPLQSGFGPVRAFGPASAAHFPFEWRWVGAG